MSFRMIESFSLVADSADLVSHGWLKCEGTITTDVDMPDKQVYRLDSNQMLTMSGSLATMYHSTTSFWFKTTSLLGTGADCYIVSCGSRPDWPTAFTHCGLKYGSDGTLTLVGDMEEVMAGSSPGVIKADTWHHIEYQAEISGTGVCRVYVDGFSVLHSGGNFREYQSDYSHKIMGSSDTHFFSDIVIQGGDNESGIKEIIGPHKMYTLLPEADTAVNDFTGSVADIDDPLNAPADTATFISGSALNAACEFTLADLPDSPSSIIGVQLTTVARRTELAPRGVTAYIKGVASSDGVEHSAGMNFAGYNDSFFVSPDTASAFSAEEINGLKIGYKITT